MFGVSRAVWSILGRFILVALIFLSGPSCDQARIAKQEDEIARLNAIIDRLNRNIDQLRTELAAAKKQDRSGATQKVRETKPQRSTKPPARSKSSRTLSVRASGKLTQTGTGAASGLFFIVLDNRVQCFFSHAGLSAGYEQMKRFQKSPATTLIVSGTDAGTMPLSGMRRLDECKIEGWR